MPTGTDLTVRVLDLLGVTQVGQDPAPEDVGKVQSFVAPLVKVLQDERVASIDPANIADGVFDQFATVLANMAAPAFGQARDRATIDADKNALRVAQAAEGGAFSRRRTEFAGSALRSMQANPGFAGTDSRQLQAGSSFAGAVSRQLGAASSFVGVAQRPLQGAK